MKLISSKEVGKNRWELEIEIEPEAFNKEVDKVYNRQKKNIVIPGFRKGKAPRNFIEKFYGEKVFFEDAINAIYPYAIDDAAKEANIKLVDDHIDFDVVKIGKKEGLVFKVKVTVMPEVTVDEYKGIEVKKEEVKSVEEKDIEEEIERVRNKNSRLITCDNDTEAKMGDNVRIDFEGYVDGEQFEGGTANDISLEIGSKQFIPGFEEQIIGHKVGDEFDIVVTFPKDYHVEKLVSKEATFKTKLNSIQRKELPEVDDDFVKDVSEFDTLQEYKEDLKKKLEERYKLEAANKFENAMMDSFINLVHADIPDALIKHKIKDLIKDFEYRLQLQNISLKDYIKYTGTTQEKIEEQFRPQAEQHVKLGLGLGKVAELENVSVTDEEIEEEYKHIAQHYRLKPEQVKNFVLKDDVVSDIKKRKVVEIIKKHCIEK